MVGRSIGWVVVALALAACGAKQDGSKISKAWVRLAAVPGRPAAAYFAIRGPAEVLIDVSTDAARRAEMHETMADHGMSKMAPLKEIVGLGRITFEPGKAHLMLFDVDPAVKPGDQIKLNFRFADGTKTTGMARVVGAGDPAPY